MSNSEKEKLYLKEQLKEIGVNIKKNSDEDPCNKFKMDVNHEINYGKSFKEEFNNKCQELFEKTKKLSSCGTDIIESNKENEKDKINNKIKTSSKDINVCEEDADGNKQLESLESNECQSCLTKLKFQTLRMIIKDKEDEETNCGISKCRKCYWDEPRHEDLVKTLDSKANPKKDENLLKDSSKGMDVAKNNDVWNLDDGDDLQEKITAKIESIETSTIQPTVSVCNSLTEDNKEQEENGDEETTIKECYANETHEKEYSSSTCSYCGNIEELTSDCLFDDESSGLHEFDDIESESNVTSFTSDSYMVAQDSFPNKDKLERDMNQSEKSLDDEFSSVPMEMFLSDLTSLECSQSICFPIADVDKRQEPEENSEEGKIALPEKIDYFHSAVYSSSFSSDSCGYDADDSYSEEKPISIFSIDTSIEFSQSCQIVESCKFAMGCCGEKEMEHMSSQHPNNLNNDLPHLNELSPEGFYGSRICFQNNIAFTTMDANLWKSPLSLKCQSKNVPVSFISSFIPIEISCSSNSCNFELENCIVLELSDLDEAMMGKKSLAYLSSFQGTSIEKTDVSKQICETLNTDSIMRKNDNNDKSPYKKKNEDELLAKSINECVKSKKISKSNMKRKGRKDKGYKRKLQWDKEKKKSGRKNKQGSKKDVISKKPKEQEGKKSFLPHKEPETESYRHDHHLKGRWQKRYGDTYPLLNQRAHQDMWCGKIRNHTGAKGNQSGGGNRSQGNSGAQGGGGARHYGQWSSGGSQGSRGSNQSSGSGGDHPDDNNEKGRKHNVPNSKGNDDDGDDDDDGEDDDDDTKTTKKKGNQSDYHQKNSPDSIHVHANFAPVQQSVEIFGGSTSYSGALPNLPPPVLDDLTIITRQKKEKKFHENSSGLSGTSPLKLFLPPIDMGMVQGAEEDLHIHRRESAPNLTTAADDHYDGCLPAPCTAPVTGKGSASAVKSGRKHAVISPLQLCEIIGYSTNNADVPPELFKSFDICFTKVMHDLNFGLRESTETSQAQNFTAGSVEVLNGNTVDKPILPAFDLTAEETKGNLPQLPKLGKASPVDSKEALESPSSSVGCTVCLVVSGLISHLSHDRQQVCVPCAQVLNLMTQHARSCVSKRRPRQRITSSDLCYKICKKAGWSLENIICDSAAFKGKIQKYCDKALCKSTKGPTSSDEQDVQFSLGIGEMESMRGPDALNSGVNSSPNFSFSGNPVTLESDKTSPPSSGKHDSFVSNISEAVVPNSLSLSSGQTGIPSNSQISGVSVAAHSVAGKAHRNLSRKGSSRSPAIPQSIEEESMAAETGLAQAEGPRSHNDTDIRDFIYKRYGPKGTDPYDTQPTFGDKKGYESMPQGNLHDQEQFMSFGNRAVGVPGIGEVVFGNHKQLRLVAGFWEKKREDCERTGTIPPYQHREEGVILSQYKGLFSILRTRYQKHHQWERVAHLGNGMSGKCHLAKDLMTEFKFCCKKVHLLKYSKEEVMFWSELMNPYIVKLYGALRHGVKIYVFCEFIDGGSLAACIEEQRHLGQRFSHWAAINYFHQLLKILAYLQSKDILHEDIKADNILLRGGCTSIALTDFGTCRRLCDPKELLHKSPVGSPAHWSPEKAASQGHGFPSDLWAAVCVLIHMLSGDPPWMRRFMKSATILNFIIYSREPPLEDVPPDVQPMVRDLIASGLVKDAEKRPSADKLLGHGAFRILENKQPDRYYSTLGGLSQAAFLPKANDAEKGAQILFSAEISTGPYQESAGPTAQPATNEDSNEEAVLASEEKILGADRVASSEAITEDRRGPEIETSDSQPENLPKRLNEASSHFPYRNSHTISATNQAKEKGTSDGKSQQLPDLDNLLSSLFVPDESKAFYTDDIPDGAEALKHSTFKQQKLEVFIPEVLKESHLPNLSIFGMDLSDGSGQGGSTTITPKSVLEGAGEPQHSASQYNAGSIENENLRPALSSAREIENANGISFNLSSESEGYTSADLFDQGPETIKNPNATFDSQPLFQNTGKPSPNDYDNSFNSPSMATHFQQRKPNHIRLNVSPTGSGSMLQLYAEGGSGATSNRTSLRGPLSHRTPSTGLLSAASSSNRLGGSSTSSSRASPLPFHFNMPAGRSSVLEEQDKLMQMYKAEQESLSSSGSELFNDDHVPAQEYNAADKMGDEDWQLALSRLQDNIEISSLEGHGLQIFDEENMQVVLQARFMETPVNKRQLIEGISGRLSIKYGHFSLFHMDKSPLKLSTPLEAHKLLVRKLPTPQKGCLCENCRSKF